MTKKPKEIIESLKTTEEKLEEIESKLTAVTNFYKSILNFKKDQNLEDKILEMIIEIKILLEFSLNVKTQLDLFIKKKLKRVSKPKNSFDAGKKFAFLELKKFLDKRSR